MPADGQSPFLSERPPSAVLRHWSSSGLLQTGQCFSGKLRFRQEQEHPESVPVLPVLSAFLQQRRNASCTALPALSRDAAYTVHGAGSRRCSVQFLRSGASADPAAGGSGRSDCARCSFRLQHRQTAPCPSGSHWSVPETETAFLPGNPGRVRQTAVRRYLHSSPGHLQ